MSTCKYETVSWKNCDKRGEIPRCTDLTMFPADIMTCFERHLSKGIILNDLFQTNANVTGKSCSVGTEKKEMSRVCCDCVLHKENLCGRPGTHVLKHSRWFVCYSEIEFCSCNMLNFDLKSVPTPTQRLGRARSINIYVVIHINL